MAKNIYVGVSDVAKKAKRIYVGVDGKARKVKKIYVGVNGIARLAYASEFEFSYSGSYRFSGNPDGNWELKLLNSGTLTITSIPTPIDIFLVGGGGGGSKFAGGGGGYPSTVHNLKISEGSYSMTVGGGGNPEAGGGNSYAFNESYYASSGHGASWQTGGSGNAKGGDYYADGWEGSPNVCYGGDSNVTAFDGGGTYFGGGGGATYGEPGEAENYIGYSGGRGGGGHAGSRFQYYPENNVSGDAGTPNTGGGGGADFITNGKPGGSGIIIIRNAR